MKACWAAVPGTCTAVAGGLFLVYFGAAGADRLWYWSMKEEDLKRLPMQGWVAFLQGKKPDYPEEALRADLATIRKKMAGVRADTTTPDTRLSDDSLPYNPAEVTNIVNLMLGGLHSGNKTLVLHSRVRYFDADKRRSGLPDDVAALVERLPIRDKRSVTHPRSSCKLRGCMLEGQDIGWHWG
jgi:hypothetical protein